MSFWRIKLSWVLIFGLLDIDLYLAANCGSHLASVAKNCIHNAKIQKTLCCKSLYSWNENFCWCDSNAFLALSSLAKNNYALIFRGKDCNFGKLFFPKNMLQELTRSEIKASCPEHMHSTNSKSLNVQHERFTSNQNTYEVGKRLDTIQKLFQLGDIFSDPRKNLKEYLQNMLTPDVTLYAIGSIFLFSRTSFLEYLSWKSQIGSTQAWNINIIQASIKWTSKDDVSFILSKQVAGFSLTSFFFVKFEENSSRIREIVLLESEIIEQYDQFVYYDPPNTLFWPSMISSKKMCTFIRKKCSGRRYPFRDEGHCRSYYSSLFDSNSITCMLESTSSSLTALHGDSFICRMYYMKLATLEEKYCVFLGNNDFGKCKKFSCKGKSMNNLFLKPNPRFTRTPEFICNIQGCKEIWV